MVKFLGHTFLFLLFFMLVTSVFSVPSPFSGTIGNQEEDEPHPATSAADSQNVPSSTSGQTMSDNVNRQPDANSNTQTPPPDPEQTIYPGVINCRLQLGGDGQPAISIYYPRFQDSKGVDEAIKNFVDDQAKDYNADVRDSIGPDGEKPSFYDMWELTGFYTLDRPTPHLASVTFNIYSFSGGAHGNLAISTLNYNLLSGRRLEFSDYFGDTDKALQILSEYCSEKLRQELGEDADEDMIQNGTEPSINNFSNISLIPSGLVVQFQPYQVGPWSIGPQHVQIDISRLAAAKPNSQIWPDWNRTDTSLKDVETKPAQ